MSYIITTLCLEDYNTHVGDNYIQVKKHWLDRTREKCKNVKDIVVFDETNISQDEITRFKYEFAWWDIIRLQKNILLCSNNSIPIVQIDMEIILEKDIQSLVELPYDFIISTEIGGNKSFPRECSEKLGFGVCTCFLVVKPTAIPFLQKIVENIFNKKYGSLSDQVNIMNYIVNHPHTCTDEICIIDGIEFKNKKIEIDGILIGVLDFNIITRDPVLSAHQYGNHINIENVGGIQNFIRYFYEPLENLPLTCRCGKTHLGDNSICKHIDMRK